MLSIYVVLGHTDYEGCRLIDIFTDEGKALDEAQKHATFYDRVDVEKWGVSPGQDSMLDRSYERTFWRRAKNHLTYRGVSPTPRQE